MAADRDGLIAGVKALRAKAVPGFLEPSPADAPPDAYPLTALTYAAVTPRSLDAVARREYAAFVAYAADPGQVPGSEYGQLPAGYQPLPEDLRAQARSAATAIADPPEGDTGIQSTSTDPQAGGTAPTGEPGPAPAGATGDAAPEVPAVASATPPAGEPSVPSTRLARIVDAATTPFQDLAATRYALPLLVMVAMLSALGALEITKGRSRLVRRGGGTELVAVEPEDSA